MEPPTADLPADVQPTQNDEVHWLAGSGVSTAPRASRRNGPAVAPTDDALWGPGPAKAQTTVPYEIHWPNDGGVSTQPRASTQKTSARQNGTQAARSLPLGVAPSVPGAAKRTDLSQSAPSRQAVSEEATQAAPAAVSPVPAPPPTAAVTDVPSNSQAPEIPVKAAAEGSAPNVTAAGGPAPHPHEMAFSARVQAVPSVEQSAYPVEMASAATATSASQKVVAAANDASASPAAPTDAGSWRSGAAKARTTAGGKTPRFQPTQPYETHRPNDGAGVSTQPLARQNVTQTARSLPVGVASSAPVSKHTSPSQSSPRRQAVSDETTQAAAVAVSPEPAPPLTAMLPAATDDAAGHEALAVPLQTAVPHGDLGEAAEAPTPNVTAAGPVQHPQEMAFAARIQPVQSVDQSALPAELAAAAAVASANKKAVAAVDGLSASPADAHELPAATTVPLERNGEPVSQSSQAAPAPAASHRTEDPVPLAESQPKVSAPLRDISLQVTQAGRERVDVRVVQQGGEVHVSVHSGDANLTGGLRQGLSELQGRLEENGYRSEMWRPGDSAPPPTPAPEAQASTNHSRGGGGQPQQGGSQQDSGQRNPNQSNQPRWVEELESSLDGGEKSSGGFHGFTS